MLSSPVAVISTKILGDNKVGRIVFIGGTGSISQNFIENSAFSNMDFITNSVKYLSSDSTMLSVSPKNISASNIDISVGQAKFLMVLTIGIIPILILCIGIFVWLKRRKL